MADIIERLRNPFWKDDPKGGVIHMTTIEAVEDDMAEGATEIERLRLWIRRIENINDSPSCFNPDIDAACRAAFHGLPMNGKINVQLPDLPDKE